jgi:glycyl-tRNA synthetase beta chain
MSAPLVVELVCEELPPKALSRLGTAFANGIRDGLAKRGVLDAGEEALVFCTPRRLAAGFRAVREASEAKSVEVKLMPAAVGLDANGRATPALSKKLQALGLGGADPSKFARRIDGKSETLFVQATTPPVPLAQALQAALDEAIAALPIPKVMSYQLADGVTTVHFARPAHALVALHGANVVPVNALGLAADRVTHGHRFQGAKRIPIARADDYERALAEEGGVVASFTRRRAQVAEQLGAAAKAHGASLGAEGDYAALLDEVTALVERPTVYSGTFEPEFLSVPPECLVLTMRQNQKYFPLFDAAGNLTNRFLIVSNMRLADAANIVHGNERVVRPRLADARFFFETDKQAKLADRVPQLGSRTYHNKLGTDLERVERLRRLASRIQAMLPRGEKGRPYADRAALLAKADLVTLMVGEFPELQGTMGRYYAEADGEEPSVVRAIEQHYWPRFSGDQIPTADVSVAVALADKLDAIVGMFGIGQQPTGDRDPFALRRHALGIIRIIVEGRFDLSLAELIDAAFDGFDKTKPGLLGEAHTEVQIFILERLRGYLRDLGYTAIEVEAIISQNPVRLAPIPRQLEAVRAFMALEESQSLAAANKRVVNILRQAQAKGLSFSSAREDALKEPAEVELFRSLASASTAASALFDKGDYSGYLCAFAVLKAPVDRFFDDVMVMVEDHRLRDNRLALLSDLREAMNRVADISKLAS